MLRPLRWNLFHNPSCSCIYGLLMIRPTYWIFSAAHYVWGCRAYWFQNNNNNQPPSLQSFPSFDTNCNVSPVVSTQCETPKIRVHTAVFVNIDGHFAISINALSKHRQKVYIKCFMLTLETPPGVFHCIFRARKARKLITASESV